MPQMQRIGRGDAAPIQKLLGSASEVSGDFSVSADDTSVFVMTRRPEDVRRVLDDAGYGYSVAALRNGSTLFAVTSRLVSG